MKDLLSKLIAFGLILTGCSNGDAPLNPAEIQSQKPTSVVRSQEEAVQIAIAHMNDRNNGSRALSYAVADVSIVSKNRSRTNPDTLIYIINFTDDQGFALVSAAMSGEEILGYADEGIVAENDIDTNPAFGFFMDAAMDYVENQLYVVPDSSLTLPVDTVRMRSVETIRPRVKVKWGQHYPEGLFCPNGICGCVQTAMAQAMSHFKYPESIDLTYENAPETSVVLDWNEILKHTQSCFTPDSAYHLQNCASDLSAHYELAYLCRELGERNNANYQNGVTTTSLEASRKTATSLLAPVCKVSPYKEYEGAEILFEFMKENDAVGIIQGFVNYFNGHCWVMSGGELVTTILKDKVTGNLISETKTYFLHYNWGWNGSNNGYFIQDVFDPSTPSKLSRSNYNKWVDYYWIFK